MDLGDGFVKEPFEVRSGAIFHRWWWMVPDLNHGGGSWVSGGHNCERFRDLKEWYCWSRREDQMVVIC